MQVRLLGPVDVLAGGEPVALTGLRRTAILAVLALHAGETVSTSRLIEVVWGDKGATTSLNTVQSHVSYLRRVLGARAAIAARPPGYVLDLPAEPTDVVVAERLIRAGRRAADPARGVELLRAALALWRGQPLVNVADVAWLAEQSDRLLALELQARTALVDAQLSLGEHTELVPELRRLAAEQPFDEHVQAQLVLALYRAGRQAEALAVLGRVRATLAAELGIDPGPALRDLQEAVLRQDAALDLSAPTVRVSAVEPEPPLTTSTGAPSTGAPARITTTPAPAGADRPTSSGHSGPPLVGRSDELATLERLLDGVDTGTAPVVLVTGEPGIGKTRLLTELARRAAARGRVVLSGRAAEMEQDVPFAIIGNALDDHLAAVGPAAFAYGPPDELRLLREVLPMLPGPDTDDASQGMLAAERYQLHRALRHTLEWLAQPSGLVVILDDLHWTDDGSAELLDHLLRHPPRGPVLIAASYRPRQLSGRLRRAVGRASQDGVAELVELGPLSRSQADELLSERLGDTRRRELYEASGGNPFYLQSLAKAKLTADAVDASDGDDCLPPQVRAVLTAELDALSSAEALVVRAAAVVGGAVEPELLARVAELPVAELLGVVDELVARDLLRPTPRSGRFQFRHPLLRRVAYDAAGAGWRVRAHARAAAALRQHGAPAAEQAHHVERSAARGDEQAVEILQAAATAALHSSPAAAANWLGAALHLLPDDLRSMPARLHLLGVRAQAQAMGGGLRESRDTLHELLHLLPPVAVDMRAQLVAICAGIERLLRRPHEAAALVRAELNRLPDHDGEAAATLLVAMAAGHHQGGYPADGREWPALAVAAARRVGDRAMLASALVEHVLADQMSGCLDVHTATRLAEAAALVDAMPDGELTHRLHAAAWLTLAETGAERLPDAWRHADRALDLARRSGQTYIIGHLHSLRSSLYGMTGDLPAAARALDDARDAAALAGSDGFLCTVVCAQGSIAALRGDLDRALRLGDEALVLADGQRDFFAATATHALAGIHLQAGQLDACAELLACGPEHYVTTPLLRSNWHLTAARAAAAQGRPADAARWADRAYIEAAISRTPRCVGMAHLARAHALLSSGGKDTAAALAQVRAAGAQFGQAGDRLRIGQAHLLAGTVLAATGEVDKARRELGRARAVFERCGAHLLQAQAQRAERRLEFPSAAAPRHLCPPVTTRRHSRPPGSRRGGPAAQ